MRFYAGPRLLIVDLCRLWDYADMLGRAGVNELMVACFWV